jgi:hypothetical protein
VSFWPKFKSGGLVPNPSLARSEATGRVSAGEVVVPEVFSPYTRQLVSIKTLLTLAGVEPSFDGVGDTLGDGRPSMSPYSQKDAVMECAWCGGYGTHKPDCKALSRNYPKTSLGTQREMTQRLRTEMDQKVERAYYRGSGRVTTTVEPPKDVRTDLQKRFDAIAEELA